MRATLIFVLLIAGLPFATAADVDLDGQCRALAQSIQTNVERLQDLQYRTIAKISQSVQGAAAQEPMVRLEMRCPGAVAGKPLSVEIFRCRGRWAAASSWSSEWPGSTFSVGSQDLKMSGPVGSGKLSGTLSLRLPEADAMVSRHQVVEYSLAIDGQITNEKLSGKFTLSGGGLPSPVQGAIAGSLTAVTAEIRPPVPAAKLRPDGMSIAQLTEFAMESEATAYRIYGSIGAIQTMADADAGREPPPVAEVIVPVRPAVGSKDDKKSSKDKSEAKPPSADEIDLDGSGDGGSEKAPPPATRGGKKPADVPVGPALAVIKQISAAVARMVRCATANFDAAKPIVVAGGGMTTEDPAFGPWFGCADLAGAGGKTNVIPEDAGSDGIQDWRSLSGWRILGPFPERPGPWPQSAALFPECFDVGEAVYRTKVAPFEQTNPREVFNFGEEIGWTGAGKAGRSGLQNAPDWRGKDDSRKAGIQRGYFYASTTVHAPRDMELWAAVGADDRARVWVNDRLAANSRYPQREAVVEDVLMFRAALREGANNVLLRCDNDEGRTYFWMRFCTRGQPRPAAAKAWQEAADKRAAAYREAMSNVRGYRVDGGNAYPRATPVTAWDMERGINIRWRVPFFIYNHSAPAIVGDKIFTQIDPDVLVCMDKNTGAILWERESSVLELNDKAQLAPANELYSAYRAARDKAVALKRTGPDAAAKTDIEQADKAAGAAARAWREFVLKACKATGWGWKDWVGHSFGTPVTDGRLIWVKYATGVAACYDLDGERKWIAPIDAVGHWNVATSPVLVGDSSKDPGKARLVIRMPGAAPTIHKLLALDAMTGQKAWEVAGLEGQCWSLSPVVVRLSDGVQDMDVVVTPGSAVLRGDDGKMLRDGIPIDSGTGTPVVYGDIVCQIADLGEGMTFQLIMLSRDVVGAKLLWSQPIQPTATGPACHDGQLYGACGGQWSMGMVALDIRTGKHLPRQGHLGQPENIGGRQYVPPTIAGPYVFFADHGTQFQGRKPYSECSVITRRPDGWIVSRNYLERPLVAPPVFDGDRMYVRSESSLMCIGYTGEEGKTYEAEVNAASVIPDLDPEQPPDCAARPIAPTPGLQPRNAEYEAPLYVNHVFNMPCGFSGPHPIADKDKMLAGFGGPDGTRFGWRTITPRWQGGLIGTSNGKCCLDLLKAAENKPNTVSYFYRILINHEARTVRVWMPTLNVDMWLAGQPIKHQDRIELKPGQYPLLIQSRVGEIPKNGMFLPLVFHDSNDPAAEIVRWRHAIDVNRAILERIVARRPDSELAKQATLLLSRVK